MVAQGDVVPVGAPAASSPSKDLAAALGEAGDNLLLASWFATDDAGRPGVTEFLRIMDTYASTDPATTSPRAGTRRCCCSTAPCGARHDRQGEPARRADRDDGIRHRWPHAGRSTSPQRARSSSTGSAASLQQPDRHVRQGQDGEGAAVDGTFVSPFEAPALHDDVPAVPPHRAGSGRHLRPRRLRHRPHLSRVGRAQLRPRRAGAARRPDLRVAVAGPRLAAGSRVGGGGGGQRRRRR